MKIHHIAADFALFMLVSPWPSLRLFIYSFSSISIFAQKVNEISSNRH